MKDKGGLGSFSSVVVGKFPVVQGKWYYEVLIKTSGAMRVGAMWPTWQTSILWATARIPGHTRGPNNASGTASNRHPTAARPGRWRTWWASSSTSTPAP